MKIKIVSRHPDHIQFKPMLKIKNKLKEREIYFVDKNPDIILYHTYKSDSEFKKKVMNYGAPVMILERVAPARILSRKEIQYDNVIGVLKSTIYRDLNLDNSDIDIYPLNDQDKKIKEGYHSKLILQSQNIDVLYKKLKIQIPKECFDKVELWYNFACYEMMKHYVKLDDPIKHNRSIDIGFYGTTKYGDSSIAITSHRTNCLKQVEKLKNYKIDISYKRVHGKNKYYNNIINSKIGLSPWGLGEKCYRDFEIILGGGIVLKPDTSFVLDWIDTYNPENKYYIPCEINYSDLEEKVEDIITNWNKYKKFRKFARDRIISHCWDSDILADHISNVFYKCSRRIK